MARDGKRKTREQLAKKRVPQLGYYIIVTDTKETEQNYFYGLRDSIPRDLQGKIVIKVSKAKTDELVEEAKVLRSLQPQYCEPWIVFDRDQVKDFDTIISKAEENNINVGWSNPCIEIWFNAYFGSMPTYMDSVKCCKGFSRVFKTNSGQYYRKSDKTIFKKLNSVGDEKVAIEIAKKKHSDWLRDGVSVPSNMNPCTTLYQLVDEINCKTKE